ncbi:MAG: hypothetical protein HQL25_01345 [Candidatus Omnitrophica bacterium]|nr:hypothetical protein [Candidatus Omnitrophota bacterium]
MNYKLKILKRFTAFFVLIIFLFNTVAVYLSFAQNVQTSVSPITPVMVQGITVYPNDPFKLDFIVSPGQNTFSQDQRKVEYTKLIKYFLASLTTPDKDLWVNLSPKEKDRIIPQALGNTEMGMEMLSQDYLLKQLTSALTDPNTKTGAEFWDKIYKDTGEKGITDIKADILSKVWIMPDKVSVVVRGNSVFVSKIKFKVLMEGDYGKDVIIPVLEREVNEGKTFATLRQIFNSLVLATWYKRNLKKSFLTKVYADKNKIMGVDQPDAQAAEKLFEKYLASFKKGAFNYIREEYDAQTQQIIPKKYFSGGVVAKIREIAEEKSDDLAMTTDAEVVTAVFKAQAQKHDLALLAEVETKEMTWEDLVAEGYSIKYVPYYDEIKMSAGFRINVYKHRQRVDSDIEIDIYPDFNLINIRSFYPEFPHETKGRGRALLRHILSAKKFAGYKIVSTASIPLCDSLRKMTDFNFEIYYDPAYADEFGTFPGEALEKEIQLIRQNKKYYSLTESARNILELVLYAANVFGKVPGEPHEYNGSSYEFMFQKDEAMLEDDFIALRDRIFAKLSNRIVPSTMIAEKLWGREYVRKFSIIKNAYDAAKANYEKEGSANNLEAYKKAEEQLKVNRKTIVGIDPHMDDRFLADPRIIRSLIEQGHRFIAFSMTTGSNSVADSRVSELLSVIGSWTDNEISIAMSADSKEMSVELLREIQSRVVSENSSEQKLRAKLLAHWLRLSVEDINKLQFGKADDIIKNYTKEEWIKKIKGFMRFIEERTAMLSWGVAFEDIKEPGSPSWYGTSVGITKEDTAFIISAVKELGKIDVIFSNGDGQVGPRTHKLTEDSVKEVIRELYLQRVIDETFMQVTYSAVWGSDTLEKSNWALVFSKLDMGAMRKGFPIYYQSQNPAEFPAEDMDMPFSEIVADRAQMNKNDVLKIMGPDLKITGDAAVSYYNIRRAGDDLPDPALFNSKSTNPAAPGGIDLDPQKWTLAEQGDRIDFPNLPKELENFDAAQLAGFSPVIVEIKKFEIGLGIK